MTVGLISVLFVAAAMIAIGAFAAAWRRDVTAALAGVPVIFAGGGIAFAGVARFAAAGAHELAGQEIAVLAAITALALAGFGAGLASREVPR